MFAQNSAIQNNENAQNIHFFFIVFAQNISVHDNPTLQTPPPPTSNTYGSTDKMKFRLDWCRFLDAERAKNLHQDGSAESALPYIPHTKEAARKDCLKKGMAEIGRAFFKVACCA